MGAAAHAVQNQPCWASFCEQTEHVSGETERPLRLSGKSHSDLPGERNGERETNWIYIFVFNPPLTRSTGPTVVLYAALVYSQGKTTTNKAKTQGSHDKKSIPFSLLSHQRKQSPVALRAKQMTGLQLPICNNAGMLFILRLFFFSASKISLILLFFNWGCLIRAKIKLAIN